MGSEKDGNFSKSVLVFALLIISPLSGFLIEFSPSLGPLTEPSAVVVVEDDWNQSGVSTSGLTVEDDGNVLIDRPGISWQIPTSTGLPITKTGAATIAVADLGEIWVIGGKDDANPQQSNDELFSKMIEAYNIDSQTLRTVTSMPNEAAYAGAVLIGGEIFVVGDWWPGTNNPSNSAKGMVQIYNISTDVWRNGTPMPALKRVGHAGVCEYGGYIWVAGGVSGSIGTDATNRTLRYDPANDQWSEVAKMNNSKFGFALIPFEDKLYAFGGGVRASSWGAPTPSKIVEVYDPALDNWTQLNTTIPKSVAGVRGTIRHNEIVLVGGINSNQVVGFSPETEVWRTLSSLPTTIGDMGVSSLNGTIHTFGGDMSTYPYGTWSQMYSQDIFFVANSSMVDGILSSDVLDLRPTTQASAQPRQFSFTASQPTGTLVELQFRSGIDATSATSKTWQGPDGTVSTWFIAGSYSLNISGKANFFQYRAHFSSTALSTWDLPTLESVTIEAAHAAFVGTIPTLAYAMGEPLNLTTEHADEAGFSAWLRLQPVQSTGSFFGDAALITLDDSGVLSLIDPQNVIHGTPTGIMTDFGITSRVNWSLTISDLIPTRNVIFTTGNLVPGQDIAAALSHVHLTSMVIDDDVTASIGIVTNAATGTNVTSGSVVPALSELEVSPSIAFADGSTIQQGEVEWRLQASTLLTNGSGWNNWSEEWTTNATDNLFVPNNVSGLCTMTMQVRTAMSINLSWDEIPLQFTIDGDHAILLASEPANDSYVDVETQRNLSLMLGDSGGPDPNNSQLEIWVEGLHDGETLSDGEAQPGEFVAINFTVQGSHGIWWVNATFNEYGNPDHGRVEVEFSGLDFAGHPLGVGGEGISVGWETRDARISEIIGVRALTESPPGLGQRIEPDATFGWEVDFFDFNSLDDVLEISLYLGGDQSLGVKWNGVSEICQALGGWINGQKISCSSSVNGDVETVSIEFSVNWEFILQGLDGGALVIVIIDKDGTNDSWSQSASWYFSNQVNATSLSIVENTGGAVGNVSAGYFASAGDEIIWTSFIEFFVSQNPLNASLTLLWSGTVIDHEWSGSTLVEAVDGYIEAAITLPSVDGQLNAEVSLWDSSGNYLLLTIDLPTIIIDGTVPLLQEPQKYIMESRYSLDDVVIVANVRETTAWTGNLTIVCQVRSFALDWPTFTAQAPPDSTFADLVLFQFNLDMQHLGDASSLSEEATFACWLSGQDDAGNQLDNNGLPNHATDPWMEMSLPSNGPDLTVDLEWKDGGKDRHPGGEYLVGMTVRNVNEAIERPIEVTVWLDHDGYSEVIYRNSKNEGLSAQHSWPMTFGLTPNASGIWAIRAIVDENNSIAELDEMNNQANISMQVEVPAEGLMGQIFTTVNIAGIIILVVAIIVGNIILQRRRADGDGNLRAGPPASRGPPSPSAAKSRPLGIDDAGRPVTETSGTETQKEITDNLDLQSAGAALAAIAPNPEDIKAKFSDDETSLPHSDETANAQQSSITPGRVDSWESLPSDGEYEYRDDGTWYVGKVCGAWKQDADGGFTKIE
ncbi:MAG TPA: hypothetical protein EYO42_02515 [Candidatus Poseidoniales archaeon]|nr:hypothetical protein [Candidatus Poseidoniales archaeon]